MTADILDFECAKLASLRKRAGKIRATILENQTPNDYLGAGGGTHRASARTIFAPVRLRVSP
jgi:hypothetical protein